MCLAASSQYFKSAVLLAKSLEKSYSHFDGIDEFLQAIIRSSAFSLTVRELGWKYLTATLDSRFEEIFCERIQQYLLEDTEEDLKRRHAASYAYECYGRKNFGFKAEKPIRISESVVVEQKEESPVSGLKYHFKIRAFYCASDIDFNIEQWILNEIYVKRGLKLRFRKIKIRSTRCSIKHKILIGLHSDKIAKGLIGLSIAQEPLGPIIFTQTKDFWKFISTNPSKDNSKEIEFHIDYSTNPGEKILIVGQSHELGSWDISKGIELKWIIGSMLGVKINLVVFPDEYKYVAVRGANCRWEGGQNRILRSDRSMIKDYWQL